MSTSGRVIKAEQLSPVGISSFRPDDALAKINDEVSNAQQRLSEERAHAAAQVQTVYDQAHQDGYRAGYDKGLQQGLSEQEAAYRSRLTEEITQRTESVVRSLEQVLQDVASRPAHWVDAWENQAVDIVVSIAERVARKSVECDSQTIARLLREILFMLARAPKITVTVHPSDRQTLEMRSDWKDALAKSAEIEFVEDPSLTRGGCRVETEHCTVDARLETQIEKLLREITRPAAIPSSSPPTDV